MNGTATLMSDTKTMEFRGEKYVATSFYYKCDITGEEFTTSEQDELFTNQLYNQYRDKYGIPFPDEIKAMRERYGLTCAMMSRILGFGENQYNLYEKGAVPSESNGKTLLLIKNADSFRGLIESVAHQFTDKEYRNIKAKLDKIITPKENAYEKQLFFGNARRSMFNGFVSLNANKVKAMVSFFIKQCNGLCPTKLNKMMFYADFYAYKDFAKGISGLQYVALPYGSVPHKYQTIYDNIDGIERQLVSFSNGNMGEILSFSNECDLSLFTEEEIDIMYKVVEKYKRYSAQEISDENHLTQAWIMNNENRSVIDYSFAFLLPDLINDI